MTTVSEEDYDDYRESYQGFCTNCKKWTRECTEPDAEDYDCPVCEMNTVIGAENALLSGGVEIG